MSPIRFTITLERGKRFEFAIFPTFAEMREAIAKVPPRGPASSERNARAACIVWEPKDAQYASFTSSLYFCEKRVTEELVVHEVVHAAKAQVKRMGLSTENSDGEEFQALYSGVLAARFWKRWEQIQRRRSAK